MNRTLLGDSVHWLGVACFCGLTILSGCSQDDGPKRESGTISGKVTLDGQPVTGGRVIFAHVEGPAAVAQIQPDGGYSVSATVGQTDVSVDHRGPPEQIPGGREGMMGPGKSLVPDKYADAKTSGLKLQVKSGTNDFPIALTSK